MAKAGDTVECAIWLDGTETDGHLRQWKVDAEYMLARSRGEPVMKLGPLRFSIKRPGEDRVPPVPDHISGPDVRLLIAEADVVGFEPTVKVNSFLNDLEPRDLRRLRQITRRIHAKCHGGQITDAECDRLIETMGPSAALGTVREGVDNRSVH